jgi:signal transduction histidine kinase/integral membrane sensor domain MASE1
MNTTDSTSGWGRTIGHTAAIALAYVLLAKLGFLFAIPPGNVTLLWFPSGLALAAALWWGGRAMAGITAGSLAVNAWSLQGSAPPAVVLGCALVTALGSALQALVAAHLTRRLAVWLEPADPLGGIKTAVATAPACLIAATIGASALYLAGLVPGSTWPQTWLTWSLGDWLGMMALGPVLILAAAARGSDRPATTAQIAAGLFGIGLALVLVVTIILHTSETEAIAANFKADAETAVIGIQESIEFDEYTLEAISSFYTSSNSFTRTEFRSFVQAFLSGDHVRHGLQALSWNPYVRWEDRAGYEAAARQEGLADFGFTERTAEGKLVNAARRPDYVAVFFIEPQEKNRAALGYDVYSNPLRQKAIERARDTGLIAATAPITLVQEQGIQLGFLVFRPMYRKGMPVTSVAERRAALHGFAVGVFRIGDLVEAGLAKRRSGKWDHQVFVFDTTPGEEQLLHAHPANLAAALKDKPPTAASLQGGPHYTRQIDVGGRPWLIVNRPAPGQISAQRSWNAWLALLGGIALTALTVFSYVRLQRSKEELESAHLLLQQNQTQLLQSEKLASIGQLAAGVAHEINNPMGFITSNLNRLAEYGRDLGELNRLYGQLELALSGGGVEAVAQARQAVAECRERVEADFMVEDLLPLVSESQEGAERVRRIVHNLRDFAHSSDEERKPADLNAGLESTLHIVWSELKYKAEVKREFGDLPLVPCRLQQLNQVFVNLLVNAAQAIEARGRITVRTYVAQGYACVEVEDTGKGMSPEVQKRLFEPFFTTKPVGQGTGLGLSISYRIVVEEHGGRIDVHSQEGVGSRLTVKVPL